MGDTALTGRTILVTRPAEQAARISQLIRDAGGRPYLFPCLEIQPPADPAQLDNILGRLDEFDFAIFVSPTAAARTFARLAGRAWPSSLKAAAVGQGTARALHGHGITDVIAPPGQADSEALLALPDLQAVAGKRVVIFRGEDGRELMAQTLAQRGASLEYAQCYRRAKPNADITPLLREHEQQTFAAIVLTSRESLANLREMLGSAWDSFKGIPTFVPHARIAEAARQQGMDCVVITTDGDAGTMQAMIKFFQS